MRNLCALVAAFSCFMLPPVTEATVLHGRITDIEGAAIQGYVLAFDDQIRVTPSTPFPGKTVIASRTGDFELNLAPGFYDVCVFSSGFTAVCKKIEILKGRGEMRYDVRLEVDPLIIKERGDRFW